MSSQSRSTSRGSSRSNSNKLPSQAPGALALDLPPEILLQIVSYLPQTSCTASPNSPLLVHSASYQAVLHSFALVSRNWYRASTAALYSRPRLGAHNFHAFVQTVCPSINPGIRRSDLAGMVRVLDLGMLVHEASKSLTARVLGRVKGSLQEFRAGQTGFGINCLAALSKCHNLCVLDLSLVCEMIPTESLLRSLNRLDRLEVFYMARSFSYLTYHIKNSSSSSSSSNNNEPAMTTAPAIKLSKSVSSSSKIMTTLQPSPPWPPNLQELHITGGLRDQSGASHYTYIIPQGFFRTSCPSLRHVSISNCDHLTSRFLTEVLIAFAPNLHSLKIGQRMGGFNDTPLRLREFVKAFPRLAELSVEHGYVQFMVKNGDHYSGAHSSINELSIGVGGAEGSAGDEHDDASPSSSMLEMITIECSTPPALKKPNLWLNNNNPFTPHYRWSCGDVFDAVADGAFPGLRRLRVSKKLGWLDTADGEAEIEELDDLMMALERESGGIRESGVWIID